MKVNKIAALYCRLSKHEDAKIESNSIANQKAILLKAAQSYGYEHTQFYIDDGFSGTAFDRPALNQLQDAIQAGHVSTVIVKDVSRLGRDYLKVGHFIEHFFPMHNVRFIAVSGGIDSNTTSIDFLPLYSVMDEWYARDISRKLKTMYQARAAKGEPIGIPVYGYTKSPDAPRNWEPDPNTAVTVQKIYHLALLGYGVQHIAGITDGIARFMDVLAMYSQIEELTRAVMHELVDYVSVYPAIRNGKEYTQKIEVSYIYIGKIEL